MNHLPSTISINSLHLSPITSAFQQKSTSEATVYQLHQTPTNKSFGNSKTGYLLKHSLRNRMRKHWLKRKCVVENGLFLIYHSDVRTISLFFASNVYFSESAYFI